MSAATTRLKNMYAGLTAHECAILRLRWRKEDRPEDPELFRSTPRYQLGDVDREMAFANAIHDNLAWFANLIEARADALRLRYTLAGAMGLWRTHAERVAEALDDGTLNEEGRAALQTLCGQAPLVAMDGKAARLEEAFLDGLAEGLSRAWAELLAADEVAAWGAERSEGEEPLHPEVRHAIEETRAGLLELAREVEMRRPGVVLPTDADPELAAVLRDKAVEREGDYRGQ